MHWLKQPFMHDWEPVPKSDSKVREGPRWRCARCGGESYRGFPLNTDLVTLPEPYTSASLTCDEAVFEKVMKS